MFRPIYKKPSSVTRNNRGELLCKSHRVTLYTVIYTIYIIIYIIYSYLYYLYNYLYYSYYTVIYIIYIINSYLYYYLYYIELFMDEVLNIQQVT